MQPGQALQPGPVGAGADGAGDDAGLGEDVHLPGTDLDVDRVAGRVGDRRVQRLVHVELRCGDEVAQPARNRPPQPVDHPERGVAVADVLDEHQHPDDVVEVPGLPAAFLGALVDREQVAGAHGHVTGDLRLAEAGAQPGDDRRELAALPLGGDEVVDEHLRAPVLVRVEHLERPVLQLALDHADAEPVRERGEDLQGDAGDLGLFRRRHEAQRPHVVQPVGDLDQ